MVPTTAAEAAGRTQPGSPSYPAVPVVGRDAEDRLLRGLLEDLRAGRPALVEVSGPPGIGRSALLRRAAALAEGAGIRVAAAQAAPEEAGLPYGVAAQLQAQPLPATAPAGHTVPWTPSHPGDASTWRPADLCAVFLAAARSRPLLVVVDDLQWADTQSLRWLQALARRLAGAPLMLLTSRNSAVPPLPYDRIEPCTLAGERSVSRHSLVLAPLSDDAVGEVLAGTWRTPADAAFRDGAVRHLEGSPALLHSVVGRFVRRGWTPVAGHLGHLAESAAEAVRERTVRTVALLPGELLDVLRAIAVSGPDCTPGLIDSLTGPRTVGTARALALLSGSGLLAPGPRPALRNKDAARAVLADLGTEHREELHARAAEWAHRAALPDRALARMLSGARRIGAPWAVEALRREAAECRATGRPALAARLLERALCEPVPPALRIRLLTDLSTAVLPTAPEAASRHLHRALHTPADAPVDAGTGRARLRAAELLVAHGDIVTPRSRIARAAADARPGSAEHSGLRALYWISEYGRPDPADDCAPSLPGNRPMRPEQAAEGAVAAWRTAQRGRDITDARRLARAGLAPQAREHVPLTVRAAAAHALVLTGDTMEARGALDDIVECAERSDARPVAGLALLVTCLAELRGGRDAAASEALDRCEEIMPSHYWHPLMAPGPLALRALVDLRRGDLDAAGRVIRAELPSGAEGGLSWAYLLYARGRVRLAGGLREPALADLLECGRQLLARQAANPSLLPWRSAAARTREPGDPLAVALLAEERRRALLWGSPATMAEALREGPPGPGGARATPRPGPGRRVSWQYRQALAALGTAPFSGHLTVDSLLGSDRAAARPSALVTGPVHPSAPAPPRAAAGGAPGRVGGGAGPLTGAELRVAVLAAEGRANRAIAEELAVTPRTVELHLTKVYRKLGIRGRPQLPAALGRTSREKP
ncbi:LuxR family transcriptional regulator [Streptomyces sp. H27-C3]|uniref:AAA family ATPase n=1 Tax=Streptomyces sp. H27-C3 TaxID=3046305 RepID=UPI0024B977EF|nr:LuxR family transcriptional regulator [Streptomyces sp. H27-C3]MDJ0460170.1 AAA family ATPase [Streptomyces sp. H27-C3]